MFAFFNQVNRPIVTVFIVGILKRLGPGREFLKASRHRSTSGINGIA